MDLRSKSITADILNILHDCKIHTLQEIADEVEVSKKTIQRHIQSLSYRYPIQTFRGGAEKGGVYLDKKYLYKGKILSIEELQLIKKALSLLQKTDNNANNPLIENLIQIFSINDEECSYGN